MVNEGIFKLEDPIENYLPSSIKVPMYYGQKITLEDLATHTSGLPENTPNLQVISPAIHIIHGSNFIKPYLILPLKQHPVHISNILIWV
jgi:beta-lactamase family protein